jgi:hypothetical protein
MHKTAQGTKAQGKKQQTAVKDVQRANVTILYIFKYFGIVQAKIQFLMISKHIISSISSILEKVYTYT